MTYYLILQEQPSFVDFLTLSDETNPERLACISFWASPEAAEEYHRQHCDTITGMLKPVLESPPTRKDFHRQCLNSASHCDSPSCRSEDPGTVGFASAPDSSSAIPETSRAGNRYTTEDANKMAITSTQSCNPKTYLREGAIYRDSSNNTIRLVSAHGDYCVYVYVAFGNSRSEIHGPVTGFTRRHVFEGVFVFVAEWVEGWNASQRKSPDRRVQALHVPSSLGAIDVASVSKPHKRRS